MKKLLVGLIAGFLGLGVASPQDYLTQLIGPFGTLNDADNSLIIPANMAQDLLNVDISPDGKSVSKRKGYGLAFSLTEATSPTHGIYNFYDTNGNDVSLFFHDVYMESSISGGSTSVLFSTGTTGATWDCADSDGYAYCVNDEGDELIKVAGDSYTSIGLASTGTMVTMTPTRLAMAGFSDNPERVWFSEEVDLASWTVGSDPTDPIWFDVVSPGYQITHITYAFNRIMWFKETSFGYILEGPTHGDWIIRTVSPEIGTNDNASVYWNGILYFRGHDAHIYAYDGSNMMLLTDEIEGTINDCQFLRHNSWTQTTADDFDGGTFTNGVYADTETVSAQLQLTFPDFFGATGFRDGTSGTKNVWTEFFSGSGDGDASTSGGCLQLQHDGGALGRINVRTTEPLADFQIGTTFHIVINLMPTDSGHLSDFYLTLSTRATTTGNPDSLDERWVMDFESTTSVKIYLASVYNQTDGNLCAPCSGDTSLPLQIDFYISTDTYNVYLNNTSVDSGSHNWANGECYLYLSYLKGTSGSGTLKIGAFGMMPQNLTYDSPVHNASNLTVWNTFTTNKLDDEGSHSFYIRASTDSFMANSSTPSWTSINNGEVPTISTGTYIQARDVFTVTSSTDQQPALYDFTIGWVEGNATDQSYAIYHDEGIWWSVTHGDGQSTNNRILIYDLNNQGWTIYDLASNGFLRRNSELYFGSASGGYIYKYGEIDNDAGSAINSYWKSKDFFVDSPFTEKEFNLISAAVDSIQNSTITVTYTLDDYSETSYDFYCYDDDSSFSKNNRTLEAGVFGTTINVKVGNNAADQPWEVFGIQVGARPKPWRETE